MPGAPARSHELTSRSPAVHAVAAAAGALLLGGFVVASSTVTATDGTQCASAWRAANGSLPFTGERSGAEADALRARCRAAGEPVMRWAYALAGSGGVLAVVAVGSYVAAVRPKAD